MRHAGKELLGRITKEEKIVLDKIIKMKKKGLSIGKIAQELGKSESYVYRRINPDYYPLKLRKSSRNITAQFY